MTEHDQLAELQARVRALEEAALGGGGFSYVRCGARSHRFTATALAAFQNLSGADQAEVKAALAALDCLFVSSHDIRKFIPIKVG
jgi:hypothetical protein